MIVGRIIGNGTLHALLKKKYRFAKHTVRLRDGNTLNIGETRCSMNPVALSSIRFEFLELTLTSIIHGARCLVD